MGFLEAFAVASEEADIVHTSVGTDIVVADRHTGIATGSVGVWGLEKGTVPSVDLAASVAWAWDAVGWVPAEACLVREDIATGRAVVGEMAVNAAEKADKDLAGNHTGKEAAQGTEGTGEDVVLVVVVAAAASAVDCEGAVVVAVEALVAVVEGMMFVRAAGGQSADSVPKEDHPVDHRYCP